MNRPLLFIVNTTTLLIYKELVMTEDSIIMYSDAWLSIVDGWERLSVLFESCKNYNVWFIEMHLLWKFHFDRAFVFIVNTAILLIYEELVMTEHIIIIYSDAWFSIVDGWERLSALFESDKNYNMWFVEMHLVWKFQGEQTITFHCKYNNIVDL